MKNASCTYFFPIVFNELSEDKHYWGIMNFLEDTYMFYKEEDLFVIKLSKYNKYDESKITAEFIKQLTDQDIVVASKELEDHIIIYITVPESLKGARELLLNGKFSELSKADKMKILQFVFTFDKDDFKVYTKVSGILNKDKGLRDQLLADWGIKDSEIPRNAELRSKINIEQETYTE